MMPRVGRAHGFDGEEGGLIPSNDLIVANDDQARAEVIEPGRALAIADFPVMSVQSRRTAHSRCLSHGRAGLHAVDANRQEGRPRLLAPSPIRWRVTALPE
jgi:hypothetical protein